MTRAGVALAALLALAGCASQRARNDDAPLPARSVDLPPEVAGTDPHRRGGPFDFKADPAALPDGGARASSDARDLPGYMDRPTQGPAGSDRPGADPWQL